MEPEKRVREEGGRQKRFRRRHEHLDQRFGFQLRHFPISLDKSQTKLDRTLIIASLCRDKGDLTILFWLAPLFIAIVGALGLDATAGLAGLRGLRWTHLPARGALVVALVLLGAATITAGMRSIPAVALGLLLAPLLHFALAFTRQRNLAPLDWSQAGVRERHCIRAVEIPLSDGAMPTLIFEPHAHAAGAIAVLHGAGAHKSFYSWPLVEALVQGGFAVCAVDIDGHGDNQRVLDFPSVLEDAEAVVAWLRPQWGWTAVVGISQGGCIAARAVAEGLNVDALAILESPATIDLTPRMIRNEHWTILRGATWRLHRYGGSLPLVRAWATRPTRTRIGTADLIRALDLPASLARVRCPLWLCYGGSDLIVPPVEARKLHAAAPQGTPLVLIPRATHLSLPLDPRAHRQLVAWLQGAASRASIAGGRSMPGADR